MLIISECLVWMYKSLFLTKSTLNNIHDLENLKQNMQHNSQSPQDKTEYMPEYKLRYIHILLLLLCHIVTKQKTS